MTWILKSLLREKPNHYNQRILHRFELNGEVFLIFGKEWFSTERFLKLFRTFTYIVNINPLAMFHFSFSFAHI